MKISNQELIKKIIAGDNIAEIELWNQHEEKVRSCVEYNLWDSECVDDIVNDAFIEIINNLRLGKIEKLEAISSYIISITRYVCFNANRRYLSKKTRSRSLGSVKNTVNNELSPDEQIEKHELYEALRDCLNELDSVNNNIILDSYFENKDDTIIAKKFNIAPNLVRQRKFRARKQLKNCLENKKIFL
ncbi:sigma-70 family RNA polymerase sigma factor [candidate division KSB1 bacterium]|nr:sigma-70 family RNA polymerase sigma factor [candidate division KSB1 bacterium]